MSQLIETITDLLLGAAHADQEFVGHEVVTIRSIVSKLHGAPFLPPERVAQIKAFDPNGFDVDGTAEKLADLDAARKRKVLELVSMVIEADEIIDLEEDAYLRRVAVGMGMSPDEFRDLTLDVDEEEDWSLYFVED